jgi:GMP synthase (glutamine-hydrolysing)
VQHSADDPSGLVGRELLLAGCTIDVVRCHLEEEQPRSLSGYAGLVVLGGDMGAYDDADYPWLTRTKDLLREAVERDVATLAICLGHQLLAVAAGGEVARAPSPQRGLVPVGRSAEAGSDRLFGAFGDRNASAIHWNNDVVVTAPQDSVLLASSGAGIQALRLRSQVYGVQFHPEVDLKTVTGWAAHDIAAGHLSPEEARERLAEIAAAATEQEKQWSAFADRFARLLRDEVPLTRGSMSHDIGG